MPEGSLMIESEIKLQLHLQVATKRSGSAWAAWCVPLDVLSQGETKAKAVEALKEAVELWFASCISRGVLQKALIEAGFQLAKDGEPIPSGASVVDIHAQKPVSLRHGHRQRQKPPDYIRVSVPAYVAVRALNAVGAPC